jgi:hypothetical protein
MPIRPTLLTIVASTLLLGSPAARAADGPSALAGVWKLDHAQSTDIKARIEESAGSANMKGGPKWATETWFPWGTSFSEGQRLDLRAFLLATVPVFETVEIDVSPREVKTIHGASGVRIFNLTRTSAGTSALSGERVKRRAVWKDGQLQLESKGDEGKLTETLTPVPADKQLRYAIRLDYKLLEKPLDLSLLYDRASNAEPAP